MNKNFRIGIVVMFLVTIFYATILAKQKANETADGNSETINLHKKLHLMAISDAQVKLEWTVPHDDVDIKKTLGFPEFSIGDLDLEAFKKTLKNENEINRLVLEGTDYIPYLTEEWLGRVLNEIMRANFYLKVDSDKIDLRPEIKQLLISVKRKKTSGEDVYTDEVLALNRALLQAIYPQETWKSRSRNLSGEFEIRYSSNTNDVPNTVNNQVLIPSLTPPNAVWDKVITGLQPRTTYYFWIRAKNEMGNWTVWSNTATVISGSFIDINAELVGVSGGGCLVWDDYDRDGDLDLAIAGYNKTLRKVTRIFRNDNGNFVDINAGLLGVDDCSLNWGDYDRDGDLDLALTGDGEWGKPLPHRKCKIYRNDNGTFVDIDAKLTGVIGPLSWGDYDNDGDLDLALAGHTGCEVITKIYRNDSGNFVDINAGLIEVNTGCLSWGDYDRDGDLDLAIAGANKEQGVTKIYRNDHGKFLDINAKLMGVGRCSYLKWIDYDNDGDLDLSFAGCGVYRTYPFINKIYRNDRGVFIDINAELVGLIGSSDWGDYDGDSDLDLAVTGIIGYIEGSGGEGEEDHPIKTSKIYRNDNGCFKDINAGLKEVNGSLSWGDYDGDGDLDLVLVGDGESKIYRNDGAVFADINAGLFGISKYRDESYVSWWDYDSDGDLDLLLAGHSSARNIGWVTKIYKCLDAEFGNLKRSVPKK